MRKLIIIIILLISSFSYYGVVDEDGEKITVYDNVVDEQSITDQVSEDDAIIERIVKENENVETKNEIVKVEQEEIENAKVQEQQNKTTDNTIKQQTIIKSAEQKARATYEKLIDLCKDDPDVIDPLRFLRQREVVHFQRFGEALRGVQDKLGEKKFYMNTCNPMAGVDLSDCKKNNCNCRD